MYSSFAQQKIDNNNNGLLSFTNLSSDVQKHLRKVYQLLSLTIVFSIIGSFLQIQYFPLTINSILPLLIFLIAIMIGITCIPKQWMLIRCSLALVFGLLQGLLIGPLINQAIEIDPQIVRSAFFLTFCVFCSIAVMSMFTKRRSYMYLGTVLHSFCMFLLLMSVFPSQFGYHISLYGGLIMFCGYVFYDTQCIIGRVEKLGISNADFVSDAVQLYVDFSAIFIRILIILMKHRNNKDSSSSGGVTMGRAVRSVKIDL